MKGVVLVGDCDIEVRELPKPMPGLAEVVLAMKASGLCGSDLRPYRTSRAQRGNPTALAVGGQGGAGLAVRGRHTCPEQQLACLTSLRDEAAVDHQFGAGDERRLIGG
ncbi:MAG TPA: hypothetical protein VGC99_24985, partial [Candidatus Tectomicrobia bacterium]